MPKIDDFEIPGQILDKIVDDISDNAILKYVQRDRDLQKGFQVKKSNIAVFRERVKAQVRRQNTLEPATRSFLSYNGFNGKFVVVLSLTALKALFNEFLTVHGGDRFLGGLLLDEREDVRKLAIDYLSANSPKIPHSQVDADVSQKEIEERLSPFIGHLLPHHKNWNSDSESATPKNNTQQNADEVSELKRELAALREKVKNTTKLQDKIDRLTGQNKDLQQTLEQTRQGLEDSRKNIKELDRTIASLRAEKKQVEEQIDARVAEQVQYELHSAMMPWLQRPLQCREDVLAHCRTDTELLGAAQQVLQQQAAQDQHFGNITALQEMQRKLVEVKNSLQTARETALNPLPQLHDVQKKIESRIVEIQKLLKISSQTDNPMVREIIARIQAATETKDLESIGQLIEDIESFGLLDSQTISDLYQAHHRKMSFFYTQSFPNVLEAPVPQNPLLKLRHYLKKNTPCHIIIDGHNLLFTMPELAGGNTGDVYSTEARASLVEKISMLAASAPQCIIRLFFDGPIASETGHGPNMTEVYSGGERGKDHRADIAIMDYIQRCCRESSAMDRFLVTDDRDLRDQARELKSNLIRIRQFGIMLM